MNTHQRLPQSSFMRLCQLASRRGVQGDIARLHRRYIEHGAADVMLIAPPGHSPNCLQEYALRFPPASTGEVLRMPVVYAAVPVAASQKSLAAAISHALGDIATPDSCTGDASFHRVVGSLRRCETQLLLIDQIGDSAIDTRSPQVAACVDWLRHLVDAMAIPLVLGGSTRAMC